MPSAAPASVSVTIRYWAGARAAAGRDSDRLELPSGVTVAAALAEAATAHADLLPVLAVASVLVDGVAARPQDAVVDGATLEVLPPFAGG